MYPSILNNNLSSNCDSLTISLLDRTISPSKSSKQARSKDNLNFKISETTHFLYKKG